MDTSRTKLDELFTTDSKLTYDGELYEGEKAVISKLNNLPKTAHKILTFDAQLVSNNDILIFVTGDVILDGKVSSPWIFAETLILRSRGTNEYAF